jgi:hypothetical protein
MTIVMMPLYSLTILFISFIVSLIITYGISDQYRDIRFFRKIIIGIIIFIISIIILAIIISIAITLHIIP